MSKHKSRLGYTLVELLVAMALTGMLLSIIWLMFVKTSSLLGEVDSLSHTIDRGRFAVERLRTDMQMVGALATVSSANDAMVQPRDLTWRVDAVYTYGGWQNDRSIMPGDVQSDNPNVSFDGVVVLGAYDNPLVFEIGNIPTTRASALILANSRGLQKLHIPDPFRTTTGYPVDFTLAEHIDPISPQWATRIMRIVDANGYMQFVKIGAEMTSADLTSTGTSEAVQVAFDTTDHPPIPKTGGSPFGIDVSAESDRYYDASVIDIFWYYVRQDPEDPRNYQLVRERLCAPSVVAATAADYTAWNPADHVLPKTECPGGTREVVIITDRVVDFQVWFDCAAAYLQPQTNGTFNFNWLTPDNSGDCMDPVNNNTELARMMHLRLSLRPENEREDLRHYQFEDSGSLMCDPASPATCNPASFPGQRLRTFDPNPGFPGATPVVTMQTDVMLNNYSYR